MRWTFDDRADALYVYVSGNEIVDTDEILPGGVMVDRDADGGMVGIEILNVSRRSPMALHDLIEPVDAIVAGFVAFARASLRSLVWSGAATRPALATDTFQIENAAHVGGTVTPTRTELQHV